MANQFYVAAGGSAANPGTLAAPWSAAFAFAGGGGQVEPGDTIWFRGGRYVGAFQPTLNGTSCCRITLRNYDNERVVFDVAGGAGPAINWPAGASYCDLWGFEHTNSEPTRITTQAGSNPPIHRGVHDDVVSTRSVGIRHINCVFHDGGNGLGTWEQAKNHEIYGCLSFDNGWHGPDRGHGHGLYIQNDPSTGASKKYVRECLVFNNFGYGIHGYTEAGQVDNIELEGCAAWGNGLPEAVYMGDRLRTAGFGIIAAHPSNDIVFRACYSYENGGAGLGSSRIGLPGSANVNLTFEDCYLGARVVFGRWSGAVRIAGNTCVGRAPENLMVQVLNNQNAVPVGWTFDSNTYYNQCALSGGLRTGYQCQSAKDPVSGNQMRFQYWQSKTGFDAHSTEILGVAPDAVFVRPNAFETGRGHVIVYNWSRAQVQHADLSPLGLTDGQEFDVVNVENFFGKPLVRARYDSANPSVAIPMTDTATTRPVGFESYPIPSTLPEFGAFLVLPYWRPMMVQEVQERVAHIETIKGDTRAAGAAERTLWADVLEAVARDGTEDARGCAVAALETRTFLSP